jgi:uncharacterized protein (TIGR02598 family)
MKFNNQPCLALPESPKLRAKQGHAKPAKFATQNSKLPSHFRTSSPSNIKNKKFPIPAPSPSPISHPLSPLKQNVRAFSLTEVVIAMGVAAIAFTSIIALFPFGLNMSKESYESTQAALIAQTILADLKDALSTKDASGNYAKLIQKGGNTFDFSANNYDTIQLSGNNSTTFYLAYNEMARTNSNLQPILVRPYAYDTNLPQWYTDGTNGAFAIVKVTISKTFVFTAGGLANPQKIDVWVETPGRFAETNRVQFLFTGVIPQQ